MNDNIDLKELWQEEPPTPPAITAVLKKATLLKRKQVYKLILVNLLLLSTCVLIGMIWYFYHPQFISTKIGIVLAILAMLLFVCFQNSLFLLLIKEDRNLSNRAYLALLLTIKEKQFFLQTTILNGYFFLLSLGIALYLWEYTLMMPLIGGILAYGGTITWILINWFYFRPKVIQQQTTELNLLIDKFEELNAQLLD